MILNLLVIFFLAFMVYWWATQGLFSGLLHLVLTIVAAVLALAVWEPIVDLLIDYIPEYAWGIGLLAPFGAILLLLRTLSDKAVGANVNFPDLANKIGGGAAGFAAGVVTAGMLVIGLQMAGPPDLFGYQAYRLDEGGQVTREDRLWVPVDSITANLMDRLGGGAFSPIGSDTPLPRVHPDLAVEASFFVQGGTPHSRRALNPAHVDVPDDGYFLLHEPPAVLGGELQLGPNERVALIGTRIEFQPRQGRSGADEDGRFRISRNQVVLACDAGDRVELHHPVGYVQGGEYGALDVGREEAYSQAAVQEERYHWVFRVPEGQEPLYLRLKQARFALPAAPVEDPRAAGQVVTAGPSAGRDVAAANGRDDGAAPAGSGQRMEPREGGAGGAAGDFIRVSDRLPFTMNSNMLSGVRLGENNAVISTRAGGAQAERQRTSIGRSLAVNNIYHDRDTSAVVQVNIGANRPQSLLGQVFEAAQQTQAPILEDNSGRRFFAMGYGVDSSGRFHFRIDRNDTLRALSQIDLGRVSADDQVILYYEVPKGVTITRFTIGRQVQDVNLRID